MWWNKKSKNKNIVNWAFDAERTASLTPLALLSFPPVSVISHYYQHNKSPFIKCPALKSALQNVYVIKSPIDIEITYDRIGPEMSMNVVKPAPASNTSALRQYLILPRFGEQKGTDANDYCSIMSVPYIFWSEDQSMMLDMMPPFLEWSNPNEVRVISGQYNIGKWKRHLEYSIELKHKVGKLIFKRGDVMFYVKLTGEDPHQRINIQPQSISTNMRLEIQQNTQLKTVQKKCPLDVLYELRSQFNKRTS